MGLLYKVYLFISLVGLLLATGCVKFEDPPLSVPPERISYPSSPCAAQLIDNEAEATYFIGSETFTFSSPVCTDDLIDCNPVEGIFKISLGEPITESGTYVLSFPFVDEGEAQIVFRAPDGFNTYQSISGLLYIELRDDDSIQLDWCDVVCTTPSSPFSEVLCSGRAICN